MKQFYELRCTKCNAEFDEKVEYATCQKCGAPLEVVLDYDALRQRLDIDKFRSTPIRSAKYLDFYPIKDKSKIVSLDEGATPLYHCKNLGKKLGLTNLYIKNEGANPTGAFKDRGSMVEITKAIELGKKSVVAASSGNMAASVSAYCAKANFPAYILVPQGTPIGKLSQTLAYGARIIQVRGNYDSIAKLTRKISDNHGLYLSGDYAFRREGQKSQAYEIIEQLGWKVPSKVFVPIGCGTNSSAIMKGFNEYKTLGFTDENPQLVGIQAKGADPVIRAFNKKSGKIEVISNPSTVCSAINVGDPLDGSLILDVLKRYNGQAYSVEDNDTLEAEKLLAKTESIFVEPAAATSLAALQQMKEQGKIDKDELIVLVLTGIGLKDPVSALKVLYSPPVVEPEFEEVEKYLKYGFYDVVATNSHSHKIIFNKKPQITELAKVLKQEFHTELNEQDLESCDKLIEKFMEKGKNILKGDLQYILEKTIRKSAERSIERPLIVLDYKVEVTKDSKAVGTVKISYKGKEQQTSSEGTGPVDSVVNAVRKALSGNCFKFKLIDYQVNITEGGTNASVNVKMTLEDDKRNKIVAMGTSPDIVAASVEAFEEGYNLLHYKNKNGRS
jgi:threonine synthase|tara:strand:+ start:26473 stop:28314 length:1842 start_codon:yes stop_codon:yes gene_type:complete